MSPLNITVYLMLTDLISRELSFLKHKTHIIFVILTPKPLLSVVVKYTMIMYVYMNAR